MPESNIVTCMLCGTENPAPEMAAAGTPTLGHHLDMAMAVKWFCPKTCFEEYRRNPHLRKRVHDWQDSCGTWARACVQHACDCEEVLCEMENLPDGLKITPSDRTRLAVLRDKLEDIEALQDDDDNALLHRVCRNINKNPWVNPKTGMKKDYGTLVEDFKKLEKLSPEERERLNG